MFAAHAGFEPCESTYTAPVEIFNVSESLERRDVELIIWSVKERRT